MVGGSLSNTGNIDKDGELDDDDAGADSKHTTKDDDGEVDDDDGNAAVKAMPSAKPVDKPIVKPKVEKVEPKPELVIDEGMPILEFAEGAFASAQTMSELKQWFSQLYTHTKKLPEEQVVITNLYNSRKAELEKK